MTSKGEENNVPGSKVTYFSSTPVFVYGVLYAMSLAVVGFQNVIKSA